MLSYLKELISFDTVSDKSNKPLIDFLANFFSDNGFALKLSGEEKNGKFNLLASYGSFDQPGIILSGHTDVVPVVDQTWNSDPFTLFIKDNFAFGRGTSDMKGFIACCMQLVQEINLKALPQSLHFAFTYDEEVGCLGIPKLLEQFADKQTNNKLVIIGEPTDLSIVTAHKGFTGFRANFIGKSGHSSQTHKGCNAIVAASQWIQCLTHLSIDLQKETDNRFEPAYTTLNVSTIKGGSALNIIPDRCQLEWEIRNIPQDNSTKSKIDKLFQHGCNYPDAIFPLPVEKIYQQITEVPAFTTSFTKQEIEYLQEKLNASKVTTAAYVTEAGFFEQTGLKTILWGPGSITQAHKPNEFVPIDQLHLCVKNLKNLIFKDP